MTLQYIISISNNETVKQIEHVYFSLRAVFPGARYDERNNIVGIGEKGKHLLCYFKQTDGKLFIKFKNGAELELPAPLQKLDENVRETIDLFNNNDFSKSRRKKREMPSGIVDWKNKEEEQTPLLHFCFGKERIVAESKKNEEYFLQLIEKFKKLYQTMLEKINATSSNKEVVTSLLDKRGKRPTLEKLGIKYDVTRERIRQVFNKQINKISRKTTLQYESGVQLFLLRNEYLSNFSLHFVDAFMYYLKANGYEYMCKAFYLSILPKKYRTEELKSLIDEKIKIEKKEGNGKKDKISTIFYKGFEVYVEEDGNLLTDLILLEKLNGVREMIANEKGARNEWIYKDRQLVVLATAKPIDRDAYVYLIGNKGNYEEYGERIVNEIRRHVLGK